MSISGEGKSVSLPVSQGRRFDFKIGYVPWKFGMGEAR